MRCGLREIVVEVSAISFLQGVLDSGSSNSATEVSDPRFAIVVATGRSSKEAPHPSSVGIEVSASD